jgi:hypothetical protein
MGPVTYEFQSFRPTEQIKCHALSAITDLMDLLPENTEYQWSFDGGTNGRLPLARLRMTSWNGKTVEMSNEDYNLLTAINKVADQAIHRLLEGMSSHESINSRNAG